MQHVRHDGKLVWISAELLAFGLSRSSPDPKAKVKPQKVSKAVIAKPKGRKRK